MSSIILATLMSCNVLVAGSSLKLVQIGERGKEGVPTSYFKHRYSVPLDLLELIPFIPGGT